MKTLSLTNHHLLVDLAILAFIATTVRLIGVGIDHLPVGDEMFHVLSAQSWASVGTLSIADGIYGRAALFTKSIGVLFTLFGDTLVVARLPALIFGILWVLLLYVWVDRYAGRLAAWIAALLLCLAPHAIELSLYSRMYTIQGFMFLLGCMTAFAIVTHDYSVIKKLSLSSFAIVCFGLAIHMHEVTLVGLVALVIALSMDFAVQHRQIFTNKAPLLWLILLLVFLIAIVSALLYQYWEFFNPYWQTFVTPAFANRDSDVRFYHKLLIASYPAMWLLMPLAVVITIYFQPRIGLFCVTMFVIIFLMHSIAGRKAERYIYYGMPFLFAIWGIALAAVVPYLNRLLTDVSHSLRANYLTIGKVDHFDLIFKSAFTFVVVIFMISGSGAFLRTINILQGESYYFGTKLSNWEEALPQLKPLIDDAPVVVTTNFPKTLYYFDRFDIAFSPVVVADVVHGEEWGLDRRTGRPAISTVESLQQVFDKYPHGIFVGERSEWRSRFRMTDEAADFLEKNAKRVELPAVSRIVAFTW